MQSLTLDRLRSVSVAGGLTDVTLRAQGGDFFVVVTTRTGEGGMLVKTRAGTPRAFSDPAKAIAVLHGIGIVSAHIDTSSWSPAQAAKGKPRPDRASAMRRLHSASEHDAWFRSEVEAGLRELADPTVELIPHEEVARRVRARLAGEPIA
jgi:hypothetical protein